MNKRVVLAWVAMVATAATAAPETNQCRNKCKDEKEGQQFIDACHRGCDVYLSKEAAERNIFINPFTALQRIDSRATLIKCTNDCNLTYHDGQAEACADGCRWQNESGGRPIARSGLGQIINLGDNGGLTITLGSMPEMPRMPQGLSNLFNQVNDMVNDQIRVQHGNLQQMLGRSEGAETRMQHGTSGGDGVFGNMFSSMHQGMQDMMRGFLGSHFGGGGGGGAKELEEQRTQDGKLIHSGGELVVIKSGPGFHEEKKYMLGPNADIEKILDSNMNDMLNHQNPMEKYIDRDQVEVFGNPELSKDPEVSSNALFADSDPWGIINEGLEGPKLPETGLKSRQLENKENVKMSNKEIQDLVKKMEHEDDARMSKLNKVVDNWQEQVYGQHHQPRFIYVDRDVCAQERSKMSWGDWFNCLHVRMGLPNWLLVSTVSLGVIFTLWLCLVIPSNPPKQKVRTPKNVNVKELEANGAVATIIMPPTNELEKVDLPPSYDDLMITSELKKKESGLEDDDDGFSAKLVLEDDEEIVEPLPQKQNGANESNA